MDGKGKQRTERKTDWLSKVLPFGDYQMWQKKNLSASPFVTWNQIVFERVNIFLLAGLGFSLTSEDRFSPLPTPRLTRDHSKELKY